MKNKIIHIIMLSIFTIMPSNVFASEEIALQVCTNSNLIIKVCKSSDFKRHRVEKALSYWRRLGYSFGQVYIDDNSKSCNGSPDVGEIVIRPPEKELESDFMAITERTAVKATGYLLFSVILIKNSDVNKERVLEHEIGHAMGWNHSDSRYHLMYEEWMHGGSSSRGLSKSIYDEKCREILK